MPLRSHTTRSGGGQKVGEEENATVLFVTVVGLPSPGVLVSPGERGVSKTTSLPFSACAGVPPVRPPSAPRALACLHVAMERWTELGRQTGGPSAYLLGILVSVRSTHVCWGYVRQCRTHCCEWILDGTTTCSRKTTNQTEKGESAIVEETRRAVHGETNNRRCLGTRTETIVISPPTPPPPLLQPLVAAHNWFVADGLLERLRRALWPRTEA